MAVLINPATGEQLEGPDENAAAAQKQFGLVTPEVYAEQQRQTQLQAEHGTIGEELQTVGEQALRSAAAPLGGVAAPEDVDVMGNPVALAPVPTSPDVAARAEANPKAAFTGKLIGSAPEYAGLGALASATGGAAAAALGAAPALGAGAGLLTESAATGALQEATAATEEERPLSAENVAKNGLMNLALGGLLHGITSAPTLYRSVFGDAKAPIQQAVENTVDRAARTGEDLSDPLVAARKSEQLTADIAETATKLQSAVEDTTPAVAKNLQAQRDALRSAADAIRETSPELADQLEQATELSGKRSYATLRELADDSHSEDVASALNSVLQDRSLWGDAAVDHANAVDAVRAAGNDPARLLEAAGAVKSDTVDQLTSQLQSHLDDQARLEGIRAGFGEQSTAGAAESTFADTDWDKARTELTTGDKQSDVAAATLAYEAPAIRTDAANQAARAFQHLDSTLKNEFSISAKHADWDTAATSWSDSRVQRQNRWIGKQGALLDRTKQVLQALDTIGYSGKGFTAHAVETLDDFAKRIRETEGGFGGEASPVARAKQVEGLKRSLDAQIGQLSSASNKVVDEATRAKLISILREPADSLRSGLETTALWGNKMARYQKAANAAWHEGIPALGRVFRDVGDQEGVVWGETGQKARIWRADPNKIAGKLRADLGGGINYQEDLSQALKTINDLIEAKEAHGIHAANLREARASLEAIKNADNMSSLLRVAEKQTLHRAQQLGHVGSEGISTGGAIAASGVIHAAEFIGRAHGVPLGNIVRSTGGYTKLGRAFTKLGEVFGKETPLPFGAKGGAIENAVRTFADSSRRRLGDLHGTNYYSTEVLGAAPAYRDMLRSTGADLGDAAPRRPPSGGGGSGGPSPEYEAARAKIDALRGQSGAVDVGVKQSKAAANFESTLSEYKTRAAAAQDALRAVDESQARLDAFKGTPDEQEAAQAAHDQLAEKAQKLADKADEDKVRQVGRRYAEARGNDPAIVQRVNDELAKIAGATDDETHDIVRAGAERVGARGEHRLAAEYTAAGKAGPDKRIYYDINGAPKVIDKGAQRGFTDFASGVAASPLGVTSAVGLGALGAYKGYQALEQHPDQPHAEYLANDSVRDTVATARALTDPTSAAAHARRLATSPSTLALFQGEHTNLQQAFTSQRDAVQRMLRNPDGVIDALGEAFGGVTPALRAQLGAKAMQVATYLQSQLPPQRGVSVTRPNGLPPSTLEARSYALKHMTALDPSTAFDDAKKGQLRHEQVDALQANWPELYNDLRSQTLVALGDGKSTVQQRQRADLLFNFGSAIDPAFSPAITAAAAQGRAAAQKSNGAPSAAPVTKLPINLAPAGLRALQQ